VCCRGWKLTSPAFSDSIRIDDKNSTKRQQQIMNNGIKIERAQKSGAAAQGVRKIILHYHLFKNAGTSLDGAFKKALASDQWVTRELPVGTVQNSKAAIDWINSAETAVCFSSHTAELPVPEIEGIDIFPIIFIRHPIDRIASAYTFEAKQNTSNFGSTLARNTSLAGYIETRLSIKTDFQCREFHARRFSAMSLDQKLSLTDKARYAFNQLPFVGLVEKYDQSLSELNRQLKEFGFASLILKNETLNVSRSHGLSLEEKLERIRKEIGDDLYLELEESNSCDLMLYELVSKRYEND